MSSADAELENLRGSLRRMYAHVQRLNALTLEAIKSWEPYDIGDDVAIAEVLRDTIETQSTLFIAKYQPLGPELLLAKAVIRVSYDLYRIARYDREIMRIIELSRGGVSPSPRLVSVASHVFNMVGIAFEAFYKGDRGLFEKVKELDNEVDEAYLEALRSIADAGSVSSSEALELLVLRHLERIADHSVYIAASTL